MKIAVVPVVAVLLVVSSARAQELQRNAFGVYAAPTFYGFAEGTAFQLATNGVGMDFGGYYARALKPSFSVRVEVRYGTRELEDAEELFDPFSSFALFRLSEEFVQFPLILQADRRLEISGHAVTVSVGGGGTVTHVFEQELLIPSGETPVLEPVGSYQRFGVVADGGVTFTVEKASAIFLRYRFDIDVATAGLPDDPDVVRRFWSTGLYVGFEYGF